MSTDFDTLSKPAITNRSSSFRELTQWVLRLYYLYAFSVSAECRVVGEEHERLGETLRDQHAIERILVDLR